MIFTELCNSIFTKAIQDYHQYDDVNTPMHNPYKEKTKEFYL